MGWKYVFMFIDLFINIGSVVVFVFDVIENFFNKVFKVDNIWSFFKFIYYYGNGFFLLYK